MGLIYTNIQHKFRKAHLLSCNEYVLADMVYQLSVSPESKIIGWCYMSRVKMAEELGLSKQSILNLIDSLVTKGFIERDDETSYLRTLRKWNILYFTDGKESLPPGKESLPHAGKESLPNNNNLDNNSDNTKLSKDNFIVGETPTLFGDDDKQPPSKPKDKKDAREENLSARAAVFVNKFNELRGTQYRVTQTVKDALKARLKNYKPEEIMKVLNTAIKDPWHKEKNFQYVTPEFILREKQIEKYLNVDFKSESQNIVLT